MSNEVTSVSIKEKATNAAKSTGEFVKNNKWKIASVVGVIIGAAVIAVAKSRANNSTETI